MFSNEINLAVSLSIVNLWRIPQSGVGGNLKSDSKKETFIQASTTPVILSKFFITIV